MNRNRILLLGLAALALSGVVTYYVYRIMQGRSRAPEEAAQIVVATNRLELGTRIDENSVRLAKWPKALAVEGSFTDVKAVVGRGAVVTVLPNEPVLESKLAPKEGGAGLTSVIPTGMRAVSVKVDDVIGVAGFVLPGTRVDVIMTGTPRGIDDVASKMILENVQVLAAGQNVQQDANGKPQKSQVVTLLVSPVEAQALALASANEHILLALRNPLDTEHKDPAAVQRTSLFRGNATAAPVEVVEKPAVAKRKTAPQPEQAAPCVVPPPPPEKKTAVELFSGRGKETVVFTEKN